MKAIVGAAIFVGLLGCGGGSGTTTSPDGGGGTGGTGSTAPPAPSSHAPTAPSGLPAGTWVDRTPCPTPTSWPLAGTGPKLAFDKARNRIVMMGAQTLAKLQEVWELDLAAGTWENRTPCTLPASWPDAHTGAALGYDESRARIVMFGRTDSIDDYQTWEWDGAAGTWEERATTAPFQPTSYQPTLVYDPQRKTMVLPDLALWEWDGATATWSERWSAPYMANSFGLGYDPDSGLVMAFGSGESSATGQELWQTDGKTWTNLTPAVLPATWPPVLADPNFVFDAELHRMFLSGNPGTGQTTAVPVVWELDPTGPTWTAPPPSPPTWPADFGAEPLAIGATGAVMLDLTTPQTPWEGRMVRWDVGAGTLLDLQPAHAPILWPMTDKVAATYDIRRARTVVFGGEYFVGTQEGMTNSQDLLEWNGTAGTWTDRQPTSGPPASWPAARIEHVMADDDRRGRALLYGGTLFGPDQPVQDVADLWEWDGTAGVWTQRMPTSATATWPPGPAPQGAMVYDESRDRAILVGAGLGDPWEWDPAGGTWVAPPGGFVGAGWDTSGRLVFDYGRKLPVGVGDVTNGAAVSEWDATAREWNEVWPGPAGAAGLAAGPNLTGAPSFGIGFDPVTSLVWLAGFGETWTWDGSAAKWTNRTATAPAGDPIGGWTQVVFDESRGTVVVFAAGLNDAGARDVLHVWERAAE